ncbi:MAG: Na/Pi symporter [Bacteroidota bacterium]
MLIGLFKLLCGIGMFVYAMHLIENAIRDLSGRRFKLFLQRNTGNKFKAILGGAVVTGFLQSSSLVSLMVLSFVGAGILSMKNALAVSLGANLGTTLDSWVVATLGFKVDIDFIAYPAVGIGGLLLTLFKKFRKLKYLSYFLIGFGLLFIGITFMKQGIEGQVKELDLKQFAEEPLIVFLLIGFVITSLIQSSSATVAITLSAISAGAVTLPAAACMVIGSEIGTTIKFILGSTGGTSAKKRVAYGNFFFNLFTALIAFSFLNQLLLLIAEVFHIRDPLIGLVAFQTTINFISILLFIPLLNPFSKLLEKLFSGVDDSVAAFINKKENETDIHPTALFRKEVEFFFFCSMKFNLELFEIDDSSMIRNNELEKIIEQKKYKSKTADEKYDWLKQLQGEIQSFYINRLFKNENELNNESDQLINAVRGCMLATKCINDISNNIDDLRQSSKSIKYDFFKQMQSETIDLYKNLNEMLSNNNKSTYNELEQLINEVQQNYQNMLNDFYVKAQLIKVLELDITTITNFNRELFTSNKAIIIALKDYLLSPEEASRFNRIPVYLT